MAQFFSIHPDNPQPRLIRRTVEIVRGGRRHRVSDRLVLRARLPSRRQGGDGAHARHPPGRRTAPFRARLPRSRRARGLCQGGQSPVPAAEARDTRQLYVHPEGDARSAEAPVASAAARRSGCAFRTIEWCTHCSPSSASRCSARRCCCRATRCRSTMRRRSASGSSTQVDLVLDSGSCGFTPTTVVDLTGEDAGDYAPGQGQHRALRALVPSAEFQVPSGRPAKMPF